MVFKKWVTLMCDARVVDKLGLFGTCAVFTDTILPAGTQVEIGRAMRAFIVGSPYDMWVPFEASEGKTYWIFPEEAGIDLDDVPGVEDIWMERFEERMYEIFKAESEFFKELRRRIERGEDV